MYRVYITYHVNSNNSNESTEKKGRGVSGWCAGRHATSYVT